MKQVMLIFRKDVRYLWREMAVYFAVLVCFAVMKPQTWPGRSSPDEFASIFVTMLQILMGLSMVVLISCAVHADTPTGDAQFWVTRPYRWGSMLGAKALFVAACVAAPFVLMQWALLWTAGLEVFASVHGFALGVAGMTVQVWIPLMVAASVTESLGAMIMFVAGLLLAWAAMLQFVMASTEARMPPRGEFAVFGPVLGVLMVSILIFQYAKRRTNRSRLAIVGVLALFLLLIFGVDRAGFGAPIRKLIDSQYPATKDDALKLVFAPGTIPYEERKQDVDMRLRGGVELRLPVHLEGLSKDIRIQEPHVAFDVMGADGPYASPWQDAVVTDDALEFVVPKTVYGWMAAGKVTMFRVQLAAEELRLARTSQVSVADRFRGPHGGMCVDKEGFVVCRFGYVQDVPTRVSLQTKVLECRTLVRSDEVAVKPWLLFPTGGRNNPVLQEPVEAVDERHICVGDVLTFSEFAPVRRVRLMVDVPVEGVAQYRVQQQ